MNTPNTSPPAASFPRAPSDDRRDPAAHRAWGRARIRLTALKAALALTLAVVAMVWLGVEARTDVLAGVRHAPVHGAPAIHARPTAYRPGAEPMQPTELFFGLSRPGGVATDAQFSSFVDELVARRDDDVHARIEAICTDYKAHYEQESVLRTDAVSCVSF